MAALPRIANFPGVMLAHGYDPAKHDPTGWLASEKLDGVRAIWNGETFLTRTAVQIFAPSWFTAQLPQGVILDGELFMGRGKFQATSGAVRRNNVNHPNWDEITYQVFDCPKEPGDLRKRLHRAQNLLKGIALPGPIRCPIVNQETIRSRDHLDSLLRYFLDLGGEGLIIRDPSAAWIATRAHTMLKVKVQDDMDAVVCGYTPGEGRHVGRVGALVCEVWRSNKADGIRFNCGTGLSDQDRDSPPPIGSIIRVGHHGLTDASIPRFPSFLGVRAESNKGA